MVYTPTHTHANHDTTTHSEHTADSSQEIWDKMTPAAIGNEPLEWSRLKWCPLEHVAIWNASKTAVTTSIASSLTHQHLTRVSINQRLRRHNNPNKHTRCASKWRTTQEPRLLWMTRAILCVRKPLLCARQAAAKIRLCWFNSGLHDDDDGKFDSFRWIKAIDSAHQ